MKTETKATPVANVTRAVLRRRGTNVGGRCESCGEWVKYAEACVVVNEFDRGVWLRVLLYHRDHYANQYGPVAS